MSHNESYVHTVDGESWVTSMPNHGGLHTCACDVCLGLSLMWLPWLQCILP